MAGDHPRSRGVYGLVGGGDESAAGSSPLARGLPGVDEVMTRRDGIIPARAGFTRGMASPRSIEWDHPRSRGVYDASTMRSPWIAGSSPLARGLRGGREIQERRPGIIPARAGFTARAARPSTAPADHPRSRGVYRCPCGDGTDDGRIIPARAGFTWRRRSPQPRTGDHPRSRGVYGLGWCSCPRPEGSSPLARGLRVRAPTARGCTRIIPARAGFTSTPAKESPCPWDHPRSRGVYDGAFHECVADTGSSPLARGLPDRRQDRGHVGGIIPARAGFTLADHWNPNDEPCYQTAFTFSANLEPAPPSSGSAVVLRRSTMTPSEA